MTKVYAERDGNRYVLHAAGHATGSPEVCAAISGILYALAGYVRNDADGSTLAYDERLESGEANLHFRGGAGAAGAFEMAVIGLKQIEARYPDLLQVEFREE